MCQFLLLEFFCFLILKTLPSDEKLPSSVLVVYYSATEAKDLVAKEIAKNLNADIFEIEPVDKYTSKDLNYLNLNSRVSKENNDESLRDVKLKQTTIDNFDKYDTILICYPIWWGAKRYGNPINA